MSTYLKLFEKHADYETYIEDSASTLPNVSYCEDMNDVHFNPYDYSKDYLTFVALEDGTISFNIQPGITTSFVTSVSYSTDDGETWTTTNNTDGRTEDLVITVNVNEGDEVLWKGIATQYAFNDEENYNIYGSIFSSTCGFNAKGNIMSLLYGDDYRNNSTLSGSYTFFFIFFRCGIVNAENLVLPATTLTEMCYCGMFRDCTSLTTAPSILPATSLAINLLGTSSATSQFSSNSHSTLLNNDVYGVDMGLDGCYGRMFNGCTSLVKAPELPATILSEGCYNNMFNGCTSLTTAPELPATTLARSCYYNMFQGCTSLTTAPSILPATTLAEQCYRSMFQGCTSLTKAPSILPATTLAEQCYWSMFADCTGLTTAPELPAIDLTFSYSSISPDAYRGIVIIGVYGYMFGNCISLTTAPELPATTLSDGCYNGMFMGCTSLTTAPELPATTLTTCCYDDMFKGCSSLNYIKAMFTTTPSSTYTSYWVDGVASSGTFVKNSSATWNVTGVHGIPTNWTVETASE